MRFTRVTLVGVVALVVFGGAYIASAAVTSEDVKGVPASDCPDALAVHEHEFGDTPDRFVPGCPNAEELEAAIAEKKVEAAGFSVEEFKQDCIDNDAKDFGACAPLFTGEPTPTEPQE